MLIDWFTVIAQLLNFLILVWLLKRFLYQPILKAMGEREKNIAKRMQEAEAQKNEAWKEKSRYSEMAGSLEQQKESMLQKARQEAESERRRLMEAAREDHRRLRTRLHQALESERANLSRDVIRRFQEEVFGLAGKVLADLADTTMEKQMAIVFARRLENLSEEERKHLSAALQASAHSVTVNSSFSLASEQQHAIEAALEKMLPPGTEVAFKTLSGKGRFSPAGGIELTTDGYKMSWSVTDYLSTLEKRIAKILEEEIEKEPKTEKHEA